MIQIQLFEIASYKVTLWAVSEISYEDSSLMVADLIHLNLRAQESAQWPLGVTENPLYILNSSFT